MLTMAMLHDAQRVLSGVINRTPVIPSTGITDECRLFLKADCLQKTGAFKLRGAYYKIATLSDEEKARGVIACSAGNHAQGVAFAARDMGIHAVICIPQGAPLSKIEATRSYGAEVVLVPGVYDDAYAEAIRLRDEKGYTFIHPFDDYSIMAGQGTIGVQAEGAASMYEALRQDKIITLPQVGTMADGIQVKTAGTLTFDMCRQYVDKVVTVSESEIAAAILTILEKQKLITEGAGAVSVAAVMAGKLDVKGKTVCALLSGGNVDVTMLERIIKHGLTAEGRIASFSTVLPDQPNALATYLAALSHEGVNVLEVYHERSSMKVGVGSCRVRMVVETRNHEHIHQLYSYLAERGYTSKE